MVGARRCPIFFVSGSKPKTTIRPISNPTNRAFLFMAESILKLKVDSQEYDSKIKRAAEGIQHYAQKCREAGGTLEHLDEGVEDFVKALGSMETVSRSAKGSVNEMTKAFTEMSVQYNKLTEEEKASPFGKALSQSLDQLKGRIQDGNNELKSIDGSLNNTGGFMDQLAQKFTINIDAIKLFNIGLQGAKAALDVAKDAFFASEANVDEWGRTIQAAQSVYEGFLISINNGDISGFISNIDDIVKAARAAYNELDKLNTMRTIQSPGFAKQEAENARMRTMLMTGKWISAADGRVSPLGLKDGDKLSPEMMRVIERQLQGGMNKIVSLTKNEIGQTGKAIDAYYNSLAKQNGMSLKEFRSGTSSWESFSEKMAGYEAYKRWDSQARTEFAKQGGRGYVDFDKNNPYAEFRKWGNFRIDKIGENSYNDLVNLIKQQQNQQSQLYSTMGQAYRTMNRVNGETVRSIMGGGGSGGGGGRGGGGVDINAIIASQFDKSMSKSNIGVDKMKPDDFAEVPSVWAMFGKEIGESLMEGIEDPMSNLNVDDFMKSYQAVADQIDETNRALQQQKMAYNLAGQAAQNFGSALSGLEDPAAKAAGTVVQAVASIALGFAMASSNANTAGTGWGWLAWLAAGASAMATTIATIHSLTGYAEGGMVKGNSYSGDNIGGLVDGSQFVGLNAGELVLNASQQNMLAQNLKGGGLEHMKVVGKLQGTDMLLLVDRTLKKNGKELAVWG